MTNIRMGTEKDVSFILSMIKELALFEKAPEQVTVTENQLREDGFGQNPLYKSLILESNDKPVGFALYYNRYSTWKGKSLYLEDLFVLPEFRGQGLGKEVFCYLAKEAVKTNCERFEWQVLDWNTSAIELYKKFGATLDAEWINCKLEGENIAKLAP